MGCRLAGARRCQSAPRIEAALLKADSSFWKAPDGEGADLTAMKLAFDGVAKVLFDFGMLTGQLLREEIPLLVWDSAIAGGWYRFASEAPARIFPERLGRYHVWRDESKDWKGLFRAETTKWLAELLEASTDTPRAESPARPDSPAAGTHGGPVAVAPEPGQSATAIPATVARQLDNAVPSSQNDPELDFTTNDGRIEAIVRYTKGWSKDFRCCNAEA
jgi:hypothetical protein